MVTLPLHMFPRNFPTDQVIRKLPTCFGLVSDTANKSATTHDMTQQTQWTFARANLLWTFHLCCGLELATGKSPTCYGIATGKLV